MVNNFIWRGETKLNFLPIGRNKIVYQDNKNILDEILVSLFVLFCKVNPFSEECELKEEFVSSEEIKMEREDEEYTTSYDMKEEYYRD